MANGGSFDSPLPRNRAERRAAARPTRRKAVAIAGGASVIAGGLQLIGAAPAWAAEHVVDTGSDDPGLGLTLREAIDGAADGDVITFADGVTDVELELGQVFIDNAITIQGPGVTFHPDATTDNDDERLFYLGDAGEVVISGATISGFSPEVYVDHGESGPPYYYDYGYSLYAQNGGAIRSEDTELTLSGVTMTGNRGDDGGAVWASGGSITVTGSTFTSNDAEQSGGALYGRYLDSMSITTSTFTSNDSDHSGGAVIVSQTESTSISGSTFQTNAAYNDGGAVYVRGFDSLAITDSTFDANSARNGGATYLRGNEYASVTITDSDLTDNNASQAGAMWLYAEEGSTSTITGSTISGNSASSAVGGIRARLYHDGGDRASLTISDTSITGNHANGSVGGLYVDAEGGVLLDHVTVSDNTSNASTGGARFNDVETDLTILDSTFTLNDAYNDAGGLSISAWANSTVTISGATIDENHAGGAGGGVKARLYDASTLAVTTTSVSGNTATTSGGGLYLDLAAYSSGEKSARITDSTIDGNEAGTTGGAIVRAGDGAVVFDRSTISNNHGSIGGGGLSVDDDVTLRSSTVSANTTTGDGGGIATATTADLTVEHSTITANVADGHGGGIIASSFTFMGGSGADVALSHTIVAGNASGVDGQDDLALIDTVFGPGTPAEPASITATWSLLGDAGTSGIADGTDGNQVGVDPLLGALAANGGPTMTHLPGTGSPAIDAGDPEVDAPGTDQRGETRIVDVIDIGSVETAVVPPTPTTTAPAPTGGGGAAPTTTTTAPPAREEMVGEAEVSDDGTADVEIETPSGPVTVRITGATPGEEVVVTVREVDEDDADVDTRGFAVQGVLYEVEVTGGTGGGRVCFPYAGGGDGSPTIIHFRDDGTREVLDTAVVGDTVCATTSSFSPFAVVVLETERVAGVDAAATAAAISAATYEPGVPVVYLAARHAVPDAIAAGAAGAPMLLVEQGSVPTSTAAELERLGAARVVVVGGPSAVSDDVVAALGATRIAGADRFETAAALAEDRFSSGAPVVYVASGTSTPDGLVAAAAAARDGGAVLLVQRDEIPDATARALAALAPERIVVVGGTAAVSDAVAATLGATRVAGADRYATAAEVAAASGGDQLVIARGDDPIDALAGSSLGLPLLLVLPDDVPASTRQALTALAPRAITVFGGTAAVSAQTEVDLAGFLAEDE